MPGLSNEEEIIARLDAVADGLVDPSSYETLRACGPYPPRHVSAVALTRALAGTAGSQPVLWRPLALQRGFTPFGQGFADPKYRLDGTMVHFEGMIACEPPLTETDAGTIVAQIDVDCAPAGKLLFGCPASNNNARFDISEQGQFMFWGMLAGGGQIDWVSIPGIHYTAAA